MHVLIVEDKSVYSSRWSRFLLHHGHSVALAGSFSEAQNELADREPDLIICDNDINPCLKHDDIFDGGFFFISEARTQGFLGRIILYTGNSRSYFEAELDITALNVRFIRKQFKPDK